MKNELVQKYLLLSKELKPYPPLNNFSPFIQASCWSTGKYFDPFYDNRTKQHLLDVIDKNEAFVMLSENKLSDSAKEVFQKYLDNPQTIQKRDSEISSRMEKVEKLYLDHTYQKVLECSNEELISQIDPIRDLIWEGNGLGFFSTFFEKDFCWELLQEARFNLSKEELDKIWEIAIQPISFSFEKQQLRFFLDLVIKGKKWEEIVESCQFFLASYFDIKSLDLVEAYLNEHYGEFKTVETAKEKLSQEEKETKEKTDKFNAWLSTLNSNQQLLTDYIQVIIRIRDTRKNFFSKGLTILWRIAEKQFEEIGLPKDLIRFYTIDEMKKGAEYLAQNKEKISNRQNGFAVLINYDGEIEMEEVDFEKAKDELNVYYLDSQTSKVDTEKNELKGHIGSPGIVKGKARIVFSPEKATDFQEGDILVAGMTRPEFVPLMRKAAGFITDEGGITCHAAIVAREMNKPCIIGTKVATKVLHDGDMVEVDADKGIVRIIN